MDKIFLLMETANLKNYRTKSRPVLCPNFELDRVSGVNLARRPPSNASMPPPPPLIIIPTDEHATREAFVVHYILKREGRIDD